MTATIRSRILCRMPAPAAAPRGTRRAGVGSGAPGRSSWPAAAATAGTSDAMGAPASGGCGDRPGEALAPAQTAGASRQPPECRRAAGAMRLRSDDLSAAIYGVPEQAGPAATVRAEIGARVHSAPDAASPPGAAFAFGHVAIQTDGSVTVDARLASRAADVVCPDDARPQSAAAGRTGGFLAAFGFLLGHDALSPVQARSARHRGDRPAPAAGSRRSARPSPSHQTAQRPSIRPSFHATGLWIVIHLPREWSERREALHRNDGAALEGGISACLGDGTGEIGGQDPPVFFRTSVARATREPPAPARRAR